jgi:hypothetical protein
MEDVKEFGTSRRRECLEPLAEGVLHLLESHGQTLVRRNDLEYDAALWLLDPELPAATELPRPRRPSPRSSWSS